jgi:hypothetical protein
VRGRICDNAKLCIEIKNPFGLGLRRQGGTCPQSIEIGLGYSISSKLAWGIDVVKDVGFPTSIRTGVECLIVDRFAVRAGLRTQPREFCFGVGLRIGNAGIDLATSLHLDLGATHEAGATYLWD